VALTSSKQLIEFIAFWATSRAIRKGSCPKTRVDIITAICGEQNVILNSLSEELPPNIYIYM